MNWSDVSEEFVKVLAMPVAARAIHLAALEQTHPDLIEEVRTLLEAYDSSGDFLDGQARPPSDFLGADPSGTWIADAPHPSSGTRLGSWEIIEPLGLGGMGGVYRVIRADGPFRQEAALKLIRKGFDTEEIIRRFRAERQILASLGHSGIARLIDGGTAPDGRPFLVMELVNGEPLLRFATSHNLDVAALVKLFRDVCAAVQYAHRKLIVHRDLKPSNILVTDEGEARLLDFGISKVVSVDGEGSTADLTGQFGLMTPEYASPEQIRGEPANTSSDVYSLGVILYELLSGSKPYRFRTRSITDILAVLTGPEPKKPSTVAARERARLLTGDLDNIVQKAMARDVEQRYASVEQLSEDLRRFLSGEPVVARQATIVYRTSKFVKRNRLAVGTAAALALSLAVGFAATVWQARKALEQRDRAEKRFEEVRRLAKSVVFEVHDAVEELPGSNAARRVLMEKAIEYYDGLASELPDDPILRQEMSRAYLRIGDVQGHPFRPNLGESRQAMVSYQRSAELSRLNVVACPDSVKYGTDHLLARHRIGILYYAMGKADSARFVADLNLQSAEALSRRYPDAVPLIGIQAATYDLIQQLLLGAGDTLAAEVLAEKQIDVARRAYEQRPADERYENLYLVALYHAAGLAEVRRDWSRASSLIRRCIERGESRRARFHDNSTSSRQVAVFYGTLGSVFMHTGMPDSAFIILDKRQALLGRLAAADPADHQIQADLAEGELLLASATRIARGPIEALPQFRRAVRSYQAASEVDTSNAIVGIGALRAVVELGDCERALSVGGSGRRQATREALASYETARRLLAGMAAKGPLSASLNETLRDVELKIAGCQAQLQAP